MNYTEKDAELFAEVQKLKDGYMPSYNRVYELSSKYIYKIINDIVKNHHTTEDLMQETYVQIYNKIGTLQEARAFYVWAGRIATNLTLRHIQKYRNEVLVTEDEDGGTEFVFDTAAADNDAFIPENILMDQEKQRLLSDILDGLSVDQKLSVQYFYYEEMSVREIAQTMNCSEGTVKSRLNYARKAIKDAVQNLEIKQGTRLYSLSAMPLFWLLFRGGAENGALAAGAGVGTAAAGVENVSNMVSGPGVVSGNVGNMVNAPGAMPGNVGNMINAPTPMYGNVGNMMNAPTPMSGNVGSMMNAPTPMPGNVGNMMNAPTPMYGNVGNMVNAPGVAAMGNTGAGAAGAGTAGTGGAAAGTGAATGATSAGATGAGVAAGATTAGSAGAGAATAAGMAGWAKALIIGLSVTTLGGGGVAAYKATHPKPEKPQTIVETTMVPEEPEVTVAPDSGADVGTEDVQEEGVINDVMLYVSYDSTPGQESYSILFSEIGGYALGSEEYASNPLAMGETYTGSLYEAYERVVENAMDYTVEGQMLIHSKEEATGAILSGCAVTINGVVYVYEVDYSNGLTSATLWKEGNSSSIFIYAMGRLVPVVAAEEVPPEEPEVEEETRGVEIGVVYQYEPNGWESESYSISIYSEGECIGIEEYTVNPIFSGGADGQFVSLYQALIGDALHFLETEGGALFTVFEGQNVEAGQRVLPSEYTITIDGQTYLVEIPFEEAFMTFYLCNDSFTDGEFTFDYDDIAISFEAKLIPLD